MATVIQSRRSTVEHWKAICYLELFFCSIGGLIIGTWGPSMPVDRILVFISNQQSMCITVVWREHVHYYNLYIKSKIPKMLGSGDPRRRVVINIHESLVKEVMLFSNNFLTNMTDYDLSTLYFYDMLTIIIFKMADHIFV